MHTLNCMGPFWWGPCEVWRISRRQRVSVSLTSQRRQKWNKLVVIRSVRQQMVHLAFCSKKFIAKHSSTTMTLTSLLTAKPYSGTRWSPVRVITHPTSPLICIILSLVVMRRVCAYETLSNLRINGIRASSTSLLPSKQASGRRSCNCRVRRPSRSTAR